MKYGNARCVTLERRLAVKNRGRNNNMRDLLLINTILLIMVMIVTFIVAMSNNPNS